MAPVRGGLTRLAAVMLIAGSLLFFVAAATPVVSDFVTANDPLQRLRSIEQHPAAWDLAMAALGAGASIAALGLSPLAGWVQQTTDRRILGILAYGAATLAIGGAVSWVVISYVRSTRPPFELAFVDADPWLFSLYRVLTRTAVLVLGVVLLGSDAPRWLGWMLILAGVVMIVDLWPQVLPPFVHYVVFLILGIGLLISQARLRPGSLQHGRDGKDA
jgi:hypothetical protein